MIEWLDRVSGLHRLADEILGQTAGSVATSDLSAPSVDDGQQSSPGHLAYFDESCAGGF
jgi:hypothetical protein